uniref:Uncharacterized protein n=1 Tax=viral metagenome TaxID=1070528 RepID=A0A6C0H869_9ZZZZ
MQNNNDRSSSDYGNQIKKKLSSLVGLLSANLIILIIITIMVTLYGNNMPLNKQTMGIFGLLICAGFVTIFSFTVWGDIKDLTEKIS